MKMIRRTTVARWMACLLLTVLLPAAATTPAVQPKPGEVPPDELGQSLSGEPVTVSAHKG